MIGQDSVAACPGPPDGDCCRPGDLDELCTAGEVVWVGAGAVGASDGRVRLVFREQVGLLVPERDDGPEHRHTLMVRRTLADVLIRRGALEEAEQTLDRLVA